MATQLDVLEMPYQGSLDLTANMTPVPAGLEVYFINNGYTIFIVNNADDMATNDVTIHSVPGDVPGTEDIVVSVATESTQVFGPFQPLYWNQSGYVYVTFEADTSMTCAALNLNF